MKMHRAPQFSPAGAPAMVPGPLVGAGPNAAGDALASPAVAYVPVRAAEDMLRVRTEQIFRHGHTPEADQRRRLDDFARDLESLARAIREDVQFRKSHEQIRRRTVKLGALAMATIDRIDGETTGGTGQ